MPKKSIIIILLALLISIPAYAQSFEAQLIEAAANGQTERVKALLEAGAYVDTREQKGRPPLRYAAVGGHAEIIRALLEAGADAYAEDNDGKTALMWAGSNKEIASLLRKGEDVQKITYEKLRQSKNYKLLLEATGKLVVMTASQEEYRD